MTSEVSLNVKVVFNLLLLVLLLLLWWFTLSRPCSKSEMKNEISTPKIKFNQLQGSSSSSSSSSSGSCSSSCSSSSSSSTSSSSSSSSGVHLFLISKART